MGCALIYEKTDFNSKEVRSTFLSCYSLCKITFFAVQAVYKKFGALYTFFIFGCVLRKSEFHIAGYFFRNPHGHINL